MKCDQDCWKCELEGCPYEDEASNQLENEIKAEKTRQMLIDDKFMSSQQRANIKYRSSEKYKENYQKWYKDWYENKGGKQYNQAYYKAYYEQNKEKIKKRQRKWFTENKEVIKQKKELKKAQMTEEEREQERLNTNMRKAKSLWALRFQKKAGRKPTSEEVEIWRKFYVMQRDLRLNT